MKKILFAIVAVFAFVSCSKDDSDIIPTDGQYVCDAMDAYYSAVLDNGRCVEFTVYIHGEYLGKWSDSDIICSGTYPNYKYRVDGSMEISAMFNGSNSFEAMLVGVLHQNYNDNEMATGWSFAVETTAPVQFYLDNRVLDADGDGLLDKQ